MDGLPDLLTIEEAAQVLRVGRTKAYAMAAEWRATGGGSGLPVVDFGHVLRVPRCQLEKIVGGPLTTHEVGEERSGTAAEREAPQVADESLPDESASTPQAAPEAAAASNLDPPSTPSRAPRRRSRRRSVSPDQPSLPFAS